jgi:hypothetical protein
VALNRSTGRSNGCTQSHFDDDLALAFSASPPIMALGSSIFDAVDYVRYAP